jgi:hypothetical protein
MHSVTLASEAATYNETLSRDRLLSCSDLQNRLPLNLPQYGRSLPIRQANRELPQSPGREMGRPESLNMLKDGSELSGSWPVLLNAAHFGVKFNNTC